MPRRKPVRGEGQSNFSIVMGGCLCRVSLLRSCKVDSEFVFSVIYNIWKAETVLHSIMNINELELQL
jgi:hypothetical protein